MKLVTRNLWSAYGTADVLLVTSNAFVTKHGELVMGRGAALQLKTKFPDYPRYFGEFLDYNGLRDKKYGIIILTLPKQTVLTKLGVFQVKYHWKDAADLDLIEYSTGLLIEAIDHFNYRQVVMNYPGIGNGRLTEEQVEPIIRRLPDNVWVCKR
jgi:hypothetical protein